MARRAVRVPVGTVSPFGARTRHPWGVQTTVDDVVTSPAVDEEEQANRAFSISMLISAVRCTLTYVVFPWVFPAIHASNNSRIGPAIGIVVGTTALLSNGFSIRRFHRSGHRWRWPVTAINVAIIVLVTILVVQDIGDLV